MKRKTWLLFLFLFLGGGLVFGQNLTLSFTELKTVDGELFLPLRQVAEFAGFVVNYAPSQLTLLQEGRELVLDREANTLDLNEHELFLTSEPVQFANTIYVNQGFVEDHLRLAVEQKEKQILLKTVTENDLVLLNQKESFSDRYLELMLQYPHLFQFEGEAELNAQILAVVNEIKENAHRDKEEFMADPWSSHFKITYYLNYLVKRNQGGLLSLVFEDYRYLGGAHGNTTKFAFNFDLEAGENYQLADLFRPGFDYLTFLNGEIKTQIAKNSYQAKHYNFEAITPDQEFYLTNNALVICFQSYEIAAYVEGRPEFKIPFANLQGLAPAFAAKLDVISNSNIQHSESLK